MTRSKSRQPVVPGARKSLDKLKGEVMYQLGYTATPNQPQQVKYDVAQKLNIPMNTTYNGQMTTEQAGKVGGKIGGSMVREMIKRAQESLTQPPNL